MLDIIQRGSCLNIIAPILYAKKEIDVHDMYIINDDIIIDDIPERFNRFKELILDIRFGTSIVASSLEVICEEENEVKIIIVFNVNRVYRNGQFIGSKPNATIMSTRTNKEDMEFLKWALEQVNKEVIRMTTYTDKNWEEFYTKRMKQVEEDKLEYVRESARDSNYPFQINNIRDMITYYRGFKAFSISGTAQELGVDYTTLQNWAIKLDITSNSLETLLEVMEKNE